MKVVEDKLRWEHQRVLAAADALRAMVSSAQPCSADALAPVRWTFTRELLLHFAHLDAEVLQPLKSDARPQVAALAARSSDDLAAVYQLFMRHVDQWLDVDPSTSWCAYREAVGLLLRRIRVRLVAQQSELYPLLPTRPSGHRVGSTVEPIDFSAQAWRVRGRLFAARPTLAAAG